MNIIFTVGYYPVYIPNVDAKFVDKLQEAVRVERDWTLEMYYESPNKLRDEVIIVKDKPISNETREKLIAEIEAAEAAKKATKVAETTE